MLQQRCNISYFAKFLGFFTHIAFKPLHISNARLKCKKSETFWSSNSAGEREEGWRDRGGGRRRDRERGGRERERER